MTDCQVCGEEVRLDDHGVWLHHPALGMRHVGVPKTHEPAEAPAPVLEDEEPAPVPDIWAHEISPKAEIMPGGARILYNAVVKAGGRAVALHSRGPRFHASQGQLLEMSDYVVVKFEREDRRAVGRWVRKTTEKGDQKWELDTAWVWYYVDGPIHPEPADSARGLSIRDWLLKYEGPYPQEAAHG